METTVRNANAKDLPAVLEIVNQAILHTTANYNYDPQTLAEQQSWLQQKQSHGFPIIVAEQAGKIVGFGTYGTFREKMGYRFTVEHSVYVFDGFSGNGIGRLLLETLINLAKNQGLHVMIGAIDAENKGSIAFHEKFGFTDCGVIKQAAFKFDRWLDLQFMQLILK